MHAPNAMATIGQNQILGSTSPALTWTAISSIPTTNDTAQVNHSCTELPLAIVANPTPSGAVGARSHE